MIKHVFVYKAGCLDGVAGAWVAKKAFGDEVEIVCLHPRKQLEVDRIRNKTIYIAGANLTGEMVTTLIRRGNRVIALSLNATYAKRLSEFFDGSIGKSCVVAAWEMFFPDKEVPEQLYLVEDRHLWIKELENSDDWCAGAHFYGLEISSFSDTMNAPIHQVCETGHILNQQRNEQVKRISRNAEMAEVGGYLVPVVNGPNWLASELGNKLAIGNPFAVVYYDTKYERIYELRSVEGGVEVNLVAEQYGGGGQPRAAGFNRPKDKSNIFI